MSDLLTSLQRELGMLEAELRNDRRYIKIERIKALLAEYGPEQVRPLPVPHTGGLPAKSAPVREPGTTKRALVRHAITSFLNQRGSAGRKEILNFVVSTGAMGHERFPMKQLGTYLSRFPEFVSNGDGEWSIKPGSHPQTIEPPSDSPKGGH